MIGVLEKAVGLEKAITISGLLKLGIAKSSEEAAEDEKLKVEDRVVNTTKWDMLKGKLSGGGGGRVLGDDSLKTLLADDVILTHDVNTVTVCIRSMSTQQQCSLLFVYSKYYCTRNTIAQHSKHSLSPNRRRQGGGCRCCGGREFNARSKKRGR